MRGEVDAVGYGLEVAPARERGAIARRLKLGARLIDFAGGGEAPNLDVTPQAHLNRLDPGETEARRLVERASSYIDRSQYSLAVSLLRRVVRESPLDVGAWYLLGFAFGEMGRRSESIECFDRVIKLSPNLALAYANRGWQRLRIRNVNGAVSDLRQATDLDPSDAMVWSHLGLALTKARDVDGAADAYRSSIFVDGENVKTCLALGWCLRRLGRKDEAEIYRKKAFGLMMRLREPKPSLPADSDYQRHAVGRVLKRESLVVDVAEVRRQRQIQQAIRTAQNPVAWMMFLILVLLLYVLLGK